MYGSVLFKDLERIEMELGINIWELTVEELFKILTVDLEYIS